MRPLYRSACACAYSEVETRLKSTKTHFQTVSLLTKRFMHKQTFPLISPYS